MKRYIIFLAALSLASCTDLASIQKDIDDMNQRLDAVEATLEGYNKSIEDLYRITSGVVLVTSYTVDEKGNAVLSLSDGTSMVIYSGLPLEEIPVVGINEDGYWTYTYLDETEIVKDAGGQPVSALPKDGVDGHVPFVSIDSEGYWCVTMDDVTTRIPGKYNFADISAIPGSIFGNVEMDGNVVVITLADNTPLRILLLGGLDIVLPEGGVTVKTSETVTATVQLVSVAKVVVDPTPLQIVLTDDAADNLSVGANGVAPGTYPVYFQIFSDAGYRMVKALEVNVIE